MTNVAELILDLQHAKEPRRELDKAIAQAIGFERKVAVVKDDNGGKTRRAEWISPVDHMPSRVPYYTFQIDAAKSLADDLAPGDAGGFTWANGRATARINNGAIFTAVTPALALCAAALSAKFHPVKNDRSDG